MRLKIATAHESESWLTFREKLKSYSLRWNSSCHGRAPCIPRSKRHIEDNKSIKRAIITDTNQLTR